MTILTVQSWSRLPTWRLKPSFLTVSYLNHCRLAEDRRHFKGTHGVDRIQGLQIATTLCKLPDSLLIAQGGESPEIGLPDRTVIATRTATDQEVEQEHEKQRGHDSIHAGEDT